MVEPRRNLNKNVSFVGCLLLVALFGKCGSKCNEGEKREFVR